MPSRSRNLPFSGQRTGYLFSMGKRESTIASLSANKIMAKPESEIDRSGFFTLLQDQELVQNQKQKLLPVSEAPV